MVSIGFAGKVVVESFSKFMNIPLLSGSELVIYKNKIYLGQICFS